MEDRLIRVEEQLKHHEREIDEIKKAQEAVAKKLDSIVSNLQAVKNWLVGAVLFAAAEQFGLIHIIEGIFK